MRGGLKHYLRLITFCCALGALFLTTSPAKAVCDGCVVAAIGTASSAQIANIRQVILGLATVSQPLVIGKEGELFATPVITPTAPIPYASLVGYFDGIFLPKLTELVKMQTGNQQKFTALQGQQGVRVAEAQAQVAHKQDVSRMQVTNAANVLGRADVLCPEPSMGQSDLAAHIMFLQSLDSIEKNAALETSGSTKTPNYAVGPAYYALKRLEERRSTTCVSTGDNGTAQNICSGNEQLENADDKPGTLLTRWTLSSNESNPQSIKFAKEYIQNVFPDRVFDALPADVMKRNPPLPMVAMLMNAKVAYTALMNTIAKPFHEELAERTPLTKDPVTNQDRGGVIAAKQSLEAAVNRAGYDGLPKEMILGDNGTMSRAALEYIRYKVYEHDPQTIITELGGMGSINQGNAIAIIAQQNLKQVTLLYDIREQIKSTNRLLGAIGSILAKDEYNALQEQISRMKNVPGN